MTGAGVAPAENGVDPGVISPSLETTSVTEVVAGAEAILAASTPPQGSAPLEGDDATRFLSRSRSYCRRVALLDALVGGVAVVVPSAFSDTLAGDIPLTALLAVLGIVGWPFAIMMVRGYQPSRIGIGQDEFRAVPRAGVAVVVCGAFPAGILNETSLLTLVVTAAPFAVVLSAAVRYLTRKWLHEKQRTGAYVRRVVVAGSPESARVLVERLLREPHCGMVVRGAFVPDPASPEVQTFPVPILGTLDQVSEVVREMHFDAVAVTSEQTRHELRRISWSLEGADVEMLVDPGLVEVAGPRMHIRPLVGFPLLQIEQPEFTGRRRMFKRATDIGLTVLGLLLCWPVLAVIAVAVKSDRGPVLFRQVRIGRDGLPFTMLKFRTMVVDAEARKANLLASNEGFGALFKMKHDPRITRVGHFLRDFSLDELPQLFNVLSGSMSLVGPRPHLADEIALMPKDAARRSLVTPGLTGMWQVSGRSDLDEDESVRLDLRYVENWSLSLDLLILWKTVFAVLKRQGAH